MCPPSTTIPVSPTFINSFVSTKLDALVLLEACLSGRLSFRPRGPRRGEPSIASGSIFVYKHDASGDQERGDGITWTLVEFDGVFEILCSSDSSGLMRKRMSVKVDGTLHHLISYYRQWDTVNGLLKSPTRLPDFRDTILRPELAAQENMQSLSPMEQFRLDLEALGTRQIRFVQIIVFLILNWIEEKYHQAFLQQRAPLLFPAILTNREYWSALSTLPIFDDKTPDNLIYQMRALLSELLWVSAGTGMPQSMEPCRRFSPLQNICLYLEAFGVPCDPLGALQPFDVDRLAQALLKSQLIGDDEIPIQPQVIESWDNSLRTKLQINCVRNDMKLSPAFTTILNVMNVTDRGAVRMGVEQSCERFPSFRKPEHCEHLLLLQCYLHSADDSVTTMLQNWTKSEEGKRSRSQLLQSFQTALTPEELALSLVVMLTLCFLNPPTDASTSQPRPANLIRLAYFLRKPNDIEESYPFLLQLLFSFWHAVASIDKERSVPIIQFLRSVTEVDESPPPSMDEGLNDYFKTRVLVKSYKDVEPVSDVVLDELSDEFSCLKESSKA